MFFSRSSLEMVYFEAIANALDAGATEIKIDIKAEAYNQPDTLKISITDNGEGFNDERYKRFSKLLDVEEKSHKGIGRLVYLCYFDKVAVNSWYNEIHQRTFDFTQDFEEENAKVSKVLYRPSGTRLRMTGYTLSKVANYSFIQADYIKKRLLEEFYARLFQLKKEGKSISITINSEIDNSEAIAELNNGDIPEFETIELESFINLIDKFYLHFLIEKVDLQIPSLIAAISVDNQTVKVDLIAQENIPIGYNRPLAKLNFSSLEFKVVDA